MKCIKCGKEISNTVYPHHLKRCNITKPIVKDIIQPIEEVLIKSASTYQDMKMNDLRKLCKERDIKGLGQSPKKVDLIKALEDIRR